MDFGALQRELNGGLSHSGSLTGSSMISSSIFDNYVFLEELGHGAYGTVTKAKRKQPTRPGLHGGNQSSSSSKQEFFAVKHIDKRRAGQKGLREVFGEVETMTLLNHPNIVHLEETYQDENSLFIVMEFVAGGELHKALKRAGRFSEQQTRRITMNLLFAVDYIHQKGIVHRDLKPANCLLTEEGELSLKIADFGFAVMAGSESCLTSFCGTTAYMAPEILLDMPYGKPVDIWAIGVIVYLLLSGDYPFVSSAGVELTEEICEGHFTFDGPTWKEVSPGAKDFISRCLVVDASKRMTVRDALKHLWIKSAISMDLSKSGSENDNAPRRKRSGRMLFRGGAIAVMAAHRLLFVNKCQSLRREGADFPLLMSFSFLVGRKFVAPGNQLNCAGMFQSYPRAVMSLMPMVEACTTLDVLDLSNNNIDSLEATQAILRAVTGHPSLQTLILDNNPFPQLTGRSLLRLARAPGRLRVISIQNTPITPDVVQQITTNLRDAERKREVSPQPPTPVTSPASSGMRSPFTGSTIPFAPRGPVLGTGAGLPGRLSSNGTSRQNSSQGHTRLPPIPSATSSAPAYSRLKR